MKSRLDPRDVGIEQMAALALGRISIAHVSSPTKTTAPRPPRERLGTLSVADGVPAPDPATTFSILLPTVVGRWLGTVSDLVQGDVLDLGCGNRPYRDWYAPLSDRSIGIDVGVDARPSASAFGEHLPIASNSVDTVLATEVLEHVDDAEASVAEIARVLRPGGWLLATVPFIYPIHEAPYDHRRFTSYGLAGMLDRHGFEVRSLAAKGGAGLLIAHFGIRGIEELLAGRRLAGVDLLTTPIVRRPILAAQRAILRRHRTSEEVTGSTSRVSLGYMVAARRLP